MVVIELYHRTVPKLTKGEIVDEEIREGIITFILMEHNIVEIVTYEEPSSILIPANYTTIY